MNCCFFPLRKQLAENQMTSKKSLVESAFDLNNLEIGTQLYQNTPVYYHWSNCAKGTQFIQNTSKNSELLSQTIEQVWKKLLQLKEVPIWLKTTEHIIPMSMFDVYVAVMGHIRKNDQEDNLFNVHDISFVSPSGPYKQTTLIQLINKSLYQDFVYYYLLKNKLPMRSFRLFVEGKVVLQYGKSHQYSSVIKVRQLTENGVLFSSNDDDLLERIELGQALKFIVLSDNIKELTKCEDKQLKANLDLFYTTDSMQYFLVETDKVTKALSYDSGISGEFYLFCRYIDMKESEFPNIVKDFLDISKKKLFKESA